MTPTLPTLPNKWEHDKEVQEWRRHHQEHKVIDEVTMQGGIILICLTCDQKLVKEDR